jgi:dipeptidyl aminopeptidase/acylaminoacyl peptidase
MLKDIRTSEQYQETESLYCAIRQPGAWQISDATEVHVSPSGLHAVFAGTIMVTLDSDPLTRICGIDLRSGDVRVLTFGPNADRMPKYSPSGRQIAFLSDRHEAGDFQLYLLDLVSGAASPASHVDGWVDYLHWSPDGKRILLGVAGYGADVSGGQGAVRTQQRSGGVASWKPTVESPNQRFRERRAWVFELETSDMRPVTGDGNNIWESVWCGSELLAAVVSPGTDEGSWYRARLRLIGINNGCSREIYVPRDQLGLPACSPSGEHLAVVEGICSDRGIVAGELRIIDTATGNVRQVDTRGTDITYTEWRSNTRLLLAGHRELSTVVGLYDSRLGVFNEVWSRKDLSVGGYYASVSGFNDSGDCAFVGESYVRAPEIGVVRGGDYSVVRSFDLGYAEQAKVIRDIECLTWKAPDGLEIQGWVLLPEGKPPYPLVMHVHGGPVQLSRPVWLARRSMSALLLLKKGYAVFFPNPRGSAGRGRDFVLPVLGDMGGADTYDFLSGLDYLVDQGIADPKRLGVTGTSYGGFMSSWLITQDPRFAAAVPVAPHTNHVTEHLISNIPDFTAAFLADTYTNIGGKYFTRSPIMYAHKAATPTLIICGALDRCTPPEEALQFHSALLQNGVKSVLLTYPEEGHGIRKLPAAIDYAARVVAWFEEHMPGPFSARTI